MARGYQRTISTPKGYSQQPEGKITLYNQTYLGFVKDNYDPLMMGRLKVWIPELSTDPNDSSKWISVNYCSPFAGASSPENLKKNGRTMPDTQQSYGFWFVPPDLENEVIIQFINGDPNRGIWIGCMYQEYMNHMVPGIPNNESFAPDNQTSFPPVSEYNKWDESQNSVDSPIRPPFDPLFAGLLQEGLMVDQERGSSSSGARRETPSNVYGIKTPSGSQFVMDDNNSNEFIRMRTKNGTQILIHDTTGYVYINSRNGNSWFEVSDSGIDMYSASSISVRSQGDFNLHVDNNFNLHVGKGMNVYVGGNKNESIRLDENKLVGGTKKESVQGDINILSKSNIKQYSEINFSVNANGFISQNSAGESNYSSGDTMYLASPNKFLNTTRGPEPEAAGEASVPLPTEKADRELNAAENYPEIDTKTVVSRLVTHEPFDLHPRSSEGSISKPVDLNSSSRISIDGKSPIPKDNGDDILPDEEFIPEDDDGTFVTPTSGTVTSGFGPRNTGIAGASRNHKGIDIAAPIGTAVVSSREGRVTRATTGASGYGTVIYVDHGNGIETRYAHLSKMNVKVGDTVKQGQVIGNVGNTGVGSGPHLHFEIRRNGTAIDPSSEISGLSKGSRVSSSTKKVVI